VAQYVGILHLALARVAQLQGDLSAAQAELAAGAPLLDQVAKVRPEKREAQINYSLLLARQGSLQLHLGQTQDALASFRRQASVLNALCGRFPDDLAARHELMLSYSHIGDVLGNPEYENAGDAAGALEAFRNMVATARFLHDADPADARAAMDYGIALLRLALVTSQSILKRDTLTHSQELLTSVVQRNPGNMVAVSYKTWAESELAALYLAERDRPAGIRYYRMALDTAETGLRGASDPSTQKGLIIAVRGLAEEQARSGARGDALATLKSGLGMAQELDGSTPLTSSLRANVARGWQVAGSVYGILSRLENGDQAIEDRATARNWNQRAVDEWQKMEEHKTLTPALRKEFYAARQALKELR
jgi:tetratricopeptide (TPR) repeat protein